MIVCSRIVASSSQFRLHWLGFWKLGIVLVWIRMWFGPAGLAIGQTTPLILLTLCVLGCVESHGFYLDIYAALPHFLLFAGCAKYDYVRPTQIY